MRYANADTERVTFITEWTRVTGAVLGESGGGGWSANLQEVISRRQDYDCLWLVSLTTPVQIWALIIQPIARHLAARAAECLGPGLQR